MNNQDTVKLLRECDAGVKMGLSSFDEVMNYVHSDRLRSCISECKAEHEGNLLTKCKTFLKSTLMTVKSQIQLQKV